MPGVHWNINCVHWLASSPAKCPLSATQWHACFLISTNAPSVVSAGVKACNMGYLKKKKKKRWRSECRWAHHWLQNLRTHSFSLCALSLLLDSISWLRYCLQCWWVAVWDHFGAISNHPLDLQAMREAQPFMVPFTGANIGIWKKKTDRKHSLCFLSTLSSITFWKQQCENTDRFMDFCENIWCHWIENLRKSLQTTQISFLFWHATIKWCDYRVLIFFFLLMHYNRHGVSNTNTA